MDEFIGIELAIKIVTKVLLKYESRGSGVDWFRAKEGISKGGLEFSLDEVDKYVRLLCGIKFAGCGETH